VPEALRPYPATTKRNQDKTARTAGIAKRDVAGKFNPGMTSKHIAKEDEEEKCCEVRKYGRPFGPIAGRMT